MGIENNVEENKPGPKRGRPNEIKLPLGLRIYPSDRELIEKKHNCKFQQFFDRVIEKEIKELKEENS